MNRRGFVAGILGGAGSLLLGRWPRPSRKHKPLTTVDVDHCAIVERVDGNESPVQIAGPAFWIVHSPQGVVRYRVDGGPWITKRGALPLTLSSDLCLFSMRGRPLLVFSEEMIVRFAHARNRAELG